MLAYYWSSWRQLTISRAKSNPVCRSTQRSLYLYFHSVVFKPKRGNVKLSRLNFISEVLSSSSLFFLCSCFIHSPSLTPTQGHKDSSISIELGQRDPYTAIPTGVHLYTYSAWFGLFRRWISLVRHLRSVCHVTPPHRTAHLPSSSLLRAGSLYVF